MGATTSAAGHLELRKVLNLPKANMMPFSPALARSGRRLAISQCDPADASVRSLAEFHKRQMFDHSPADYVFALGTAELDEPDITVWGARVDDELAGIIALRDLQDGSGEVKCMRTRPEFLRRGVARALLTAVVSESQGRAYQSLFLETGRGPAFEPAISLYMSMGFEDVQAFADYEESAFSRFLRLRLPISSKDGSVAEQASRDEP